MLNGEGGVGSEYGFGGDHDGAGPEAAGFRPVRAEGDIPEEPGVVKVARPLAERAGGRAVGAGVVQGQPDP